MALLAWAKRLTRAFTIASTLIVALSLINIASAATITGGKTFVLKNGTQTVFNLDQQITPEVQILHNPQRLVIDIPHGQLGRLNAGLEESPDISKLRIGHDNDRLRIVFDLSGPYHGRASIIQDGQYRLVADIFRDVKHTANQKPIAKELQAQNIAPTTVASPAPAPEPKPQPAPEPKPEPKPAPQPVSIQPTQPAPTIPENPYRRTKMRVIIDPGHGAHDPGAIGPNNTREKDVVLSIGKKLAAMVNEHEYMEAIMTRDDDTFLPLYDRVTFARQQKGDVFISIHANAVPKSSPKTQRGALVFILNRSGATSKLARYLEESENSSGKMGGQDIFEVEGGMRDLVYGIVQGAVIDESRILASHIITRMRDIDNVFKFAIEGANFAVLSAPDIPSVLVETTFISTPSEEEKLQDSAYQTSVARAMYKGLVGFSRQRAHLTRETAD